MRGDSVGRHERWMKASEWSWWWLGRMELGRIRDRDCLVVEALDDE